MNQEKIGKFIAFKRKEKHLTQEQLAFQLGVSKNAVSKWERGICLMDISLLQDLSKILDISIVELLNGEKLDDEDSLQKSEESLNYVITISKKKVETYQRKIILSAFF